jgi:hypothetical protein
VHAPLATSGGSLCDYAVHEFHKSVCRWTRVETQGRGALYLWHRIYGTAAALATDQRGLPRVSGVAVDLGAYEVQLPVVNFSVATVSAKEDSGTIYVTVTLSQPFGADVTIPFNVGGTASDPAKYTIDASPLVIPAGQTSGTITVHLVDTPSIQPAETVSLTLGNLTNSTPGDITSTTLNIIDVTALPTVSFAASSVSDAENAGTISLVVNLSAASPLDTTIRFTVGGTATDPSDYTIATSPLVIPAGMTSGRSPKGSHTRPKDRRPGLRPPRRGESKQCCLNEHCGESCKEVSLAYQDRCGETVSHHTEMLAGTAAKCSEKTESPLSS